MADKTTNYNLIKPIPDEFYDIEVFNENVDIIDAELKKLNDNKVDKIEGKGLSANDYTDEEKEKLENIEENAQVNVIEKIRVNGVEVTPVSKEVNISVPDETEIIDNLTSTDATSALSAAQGKILKDLMDNHMADNTPHREAVSIERKNPDDDGVFTLIEFRRSDGTLFKTSQLNGTSPYNSRTVKYYDKNENLMQTVEYSITYSNDEVVSEVIISA